MGFSAVPLHLNESTESFGKQTQENMTLYNTTRCLCVRQRFSSVGQMPVHLCLIESRASVILCNNTTDHAFERFMPVPVTRYTETKKGRNVHAFMCAQDMTLVGTKNLGCRDFTLVLLKTSPLELAITLMFTFVPINMTQETKTRLLSKLLTTR